MRSWNLQLSPAGSGLHPLGKTNIDVLEKLDTSLKVLLEWKWISSSMFIKIQLAYLCYLLKGAPLAQFWGRTEGEGSEFWNTYIKLHRPPRPSLGQRQPLQQGDQMCLMIRTDGSENWNKVLKHIIMEFSLADGSEDFWKNAPQTSCIMPIWS